MTFNSFLFIADEYHKMIGKGKDAALERQFQPITIDEPTVSSTISTLRGLKDTRKNKPVTKAPSEISTPQCTSYLGSFQFDTVYIVTI